MIKIFSFSKQLMKIIKNLVSFLYPQLVEARKGNVTPYLEIRRSRGKYVLNSATVNYSFGGVHIIFETFFKKIDLGKFELKNVLILGMGAGSIISLLREKYPKECHITAVEKDPVVIELAEKYFDVRKNRLLKIIHDDAFSFASAAEEKYDLIISDLFVDENVPDQFTTEEYLINLRRMSNKHCCIIYNKMTEKKIHKKKFEKIAVLFENIFSGSETHRLSAYGSENSLLFYNNLALLPEKTESEKTHKITLKFLLQDSKPPNPIAPA